MKLILTTKGKEKFGNVSKAYWGGWEDFGLIREGYARQDPFDPPPVTAEEWQQLACGLVDAARRAGFVMTLSVDNDATASAKPGSWSDASDALYGTYDPQTVFASVGTNMEQTLRGANIKDIPVTGWTLNGEPVTPTVDGDKLTFDIPEHWRAPLPDTDKG